MHWSRAAAAAAAVCQWRCPSSPLHCPSSELLLQYKQSSPRVCHSRPGEAIGRPGSGVGVDTSSCKRPEPSTQLREPLLLQAFEKGERGEKRLGWFYTGCCSAASLLLPLPLFRTQQQQQQPRRTPNSVQLHHAAEKHQRAWCAVTEHSLPGSSSQQQLLLLPSFGFFFASGTRQIVVADETILS